MSGNNVQKKADTALSVLKKLRESNKGKITSKSPAVASIHQFPPQEVQTAQRYMTRILSSEQPSSIAQIINAFFMMEPISSIEILENLLELQKQKFIDQGATSVSRPRHQYQYAHFFRTPRKQIAEPVHEQEFENDIAELGYSNG